MKNLDIDLVDHHEASVESSGDGYVYVTVDAEFGLIPDSPIYLEYQLLCLRDDVVVSSSDPSSAELTFENPRVYITDSFHAGEDQIPDSYKVNFRVFVPDEPVVIDTPIPPEIARQSGAFLIHSPKKGLLSREKWASGGVIAESVVVKNVAGEDDELFVNLAAKNHTQSGFVLNCESADNSDYTIFKIIDKPQVTSDYLRLHLKKDLKVTLVGYLAGDWKSTEKTAITEIKQNFQGESSSNELSELSDVGSRITVDEIMRWRSDLNLGMGVDPSSAAELVDFDDPDEYYDVIRHLCGYVIDKYQVAHEDHERDWAGNAIWLDIFKPHRIGAVQEWDGIENPTAEEADEYLSVESLSNYSGLSQAERIVLAYNYLLSMRGASLYESSDSPELGEAQWRSELEQTLQFLRYGDAENDDEDDSFFDDADSEPRVYIYCIDSASLLDEVSDDDVDSAIETINNAIQGLVDSSRIHVDENARFFLFKDDDPVEISDGDNAQSIWSLTDQASVDAVKNQTQWGYLRVAMIATASHPWDRDFLKVSGSDEIPDFNVWGFYVPSDVIAVQGYWNGDFDTGIVDYPDDDENYVGDERMDFYGLKANMFDINIYD